MNIALWVVATLLAVAFFAGGSMKATQPKDKLKKNMPWVHDFSATQVKAIGTLEILASIGLILPAALDIVPLAASGLVLIMAGAVVTHTRRHEPQVLPVNLVLGLLAAFVAWGRFGPHSF
jgi:uncharacterized membrane protein